MNKTFLKIGHRGAAGYAPENTIASFKKALSLGVDAIELDVYVCASGELVVIHDDRVDRTTNGNGYVVDKNLEELRILDAGSKEKIPLLEEVLDLIDNKVIVNIELKGTKTAELVSQIIHKYIKEKNWDKANFLVSSFNHPELKLFKKLMPEIKIGALLTGIPESYAEFGEKLGAYSVNLSMEFIDQKFVDDAHKRGLKVFIWTVNESDDIEKMKVLDVDGMFSNFPDKL